MNTALRILYLRPGAQFTIIEDDYARLHWDETINNGPPPTLAELAAISQTDLDAARLDGDAGRAVDGWSPRERLIFNMLFDQENRLRALEGKTPISRAAYRTVLIAAYKALT